MINKKEFDLLLQEIFQIENKIEEIKILNYFDDANKYEDSLEKIRQKAKEIVLDDNSEDSLDEISLEVFSELIMLDSDVDYYILKVKNIIEKSNENAIDPKALEKIKNLWATLEKDLKIWNENSHNPVEEIEFNKNIGKITLEIIVYQLQIEGILDFSKIYKNCKKEYLENAIKEVLYEGAKEEFSDSIRRNRLVNLAKNIQEKDLYDYKLWIEILRVKNVRSRDDHVEMIGNIQEKDFTENKYKEENNSNIENEQELDIIYDESIFKSISNFISNIKENLKQKRMDVTWLTIKGPAFKCKLVDSDIKYFENSINKNAVKNTRKLFIATNGIAKYNFEKNSKWENLEEIEFSNTKYTASVNLSPDKTYNCIGNDTFSDCSKLKEISLGKIEVIGERAFKNCSSLSNIVFPKGLINIGEDAFYGCSNLKKVIFLGNLQLYIAERPQNIIKCFKETKLEEIVFSDIESAFNFAIVDCPNLKNIFISNLSGISVPFKICKYKFGRQEGIVSFVGEKSLNLWKKRNTNIRFFELTEEEKKKYK